MKSMFLKITLALCLGLSPVLAADEKDITEPQAIAKVQEAVKAIKKDAEGTFAKISAGEAPYKDKENPALYVFVYDTAVNMIAHPNKDLQGKNFKGKPDVRGKKFRDEIVSLGVSKGKGWTDYHYQKPGETGIFEKTTYCEKVKGSDGKLYIVACGKYK
jgi:polar amino acid transport system substrate-binding protein